MKKNMKIILSVVIILVVAIITMTFIINKGKKYYTIEEITGKKFEDIKDIKYTEAYVEDKDTFIDEYKNAKFEITKEHKDKEPQHHEVYLIHYYECYDENNNVLFTVEYTDYPENKIYEIYEGGIRFDSDIEPVYYKRVK